MAVARAEQENELVFPQMRMKLNRLYNRCDHVDHVVAGKLVTLFLFLFRAGVMLASQPSECKQDSFRPGDRAASCRSAPAIL